jgi:uncharacterized protein (TIGR03435 family)
MMRLAILSGVALLLGSAALAQTRPTLPSFEVVSVKPTPPERLNHLRQDYCPKGGRFSASGVPAFWILEYAYRRQDYQVAGAPAWMNEFDSAYDIEGKPPGADPITDEQCRLMVRSVFADRFKLVTHTEMREASVYVLTIAKSGPKMPKGDRDKPNGGVRLNGSVQYEGTGVRTWPDGWNMATLANHLSDFAGRPVLDRTGLAGAYGVSLNFSSPNGPHREGDDFPDLFTAVQEQLGLKLESAKGPIEVMVIDHIERPSAN